VRSREGGGRTSDQADAQTHGTVVRYRFASLFLTLGRIYMYVVTDERRSVSNSRATGWASGAKRTLIRNTRKREKPEVFGSFAHGVSEPQLGKIVQTPTEESRLLVGKTSAFVLKRAATMAAADDVVDQLLQQVDKDNVIEDSRKYAESIGVDHDKVLGDTIKSLLAYELIATKVGFQSLVHTPVSLAGS
jgi:hypothetical protein